MAKFLSKQNLEHIYDYLKRDLESINIDLDTDKKYMKAVKKMMRSIDNQASENGKQMSMDNMNVFAVSKIKPFLVEMFNKLSSGKKKSANAFEPEGLSMNIMGYDINQSDAEGSSVDELDAMFKSTITDSKEITEEKQMSNDDFKKKLNEAQNSRGYADYVHSSSDFRGQIDKANQQSSNDFMKNIEKKQNQSKNDFYASLYENSANPLTDTTVNDQSEYKDALKLGLRKDAFQSIPDVSSQSLLVENQNDILKNIVVRNQDHSKDNEVEPVDGKTGLENPLEIGENALYQPILYENTQTGRERVNKIVLNIDSGTSANFATYNVTNDGTNYWARYRVNIDSQLNVDKLCEVFIESMTIVGQTVPDLCQYFAINIEEFNITSSSNNPNMRDKIIVPNTADMEYTDTGVLVNGAKALNSTDAIVVDGSNATEYFRVGDYVYTVGGQFVGIITAVTNDTSITIGGGIKIALADNTRLFIGRLKHNTNEYNLNTAYIGMINPKRLLTFAISITNQDGNDADSSSPDNNTFRDADSAENRVIFTFLLRAVNSFSDF
tara:strand:+ start:146 stop:1801 length:1656 start_codon:yes stop_codon:yes gene_type:complete